MTKEPGYQHRSTQTTGGDPVEGVDPGGTRSTHPGQADKTAAKDGKVSTEHSVTSGDRNPRSESQGPLPKDPAKGR
jgi:hypothetical protein